MDNCLECESRRPDMNILHRIRKLANKLLAPFSVALVTAEKPQWLRKKIVTAQVGRYSIQVPGISPIVTHYSRYPDYTGHLGRVALLLKKKFPNLAAIDIGANVGDTACIIKSAVDIPLLCIEGDDLTFDFLEKNIQQFQNTTAHKMFLGEKTEMIAAHLDKDGWNATLKPDKADTAPKIKIVSLDEFLAGQPNVDKYKLVKIDTEGFDCSIIRGAKNFIQQTHPVITFEYNRDNMEAIGEKGLDTLAMLASFGYSQIIFHDCDGRFFCPTSMSDQMLIGDLHDYADGKHGAIYYFDLTLFHESDSDVAQAFVKTERMWRAGKQTTNEL
jgi:FkbM family methyltransferase